MDAYLGHGHDLALSYVGIVTPPEPRTDSEGTAKVPGYEDKPFFFFSLNPFIAQLNTF